MQEASQGQLFDPRETEGESQLEEIVNLGDQLAMAGGDRQLIKDDEGLWSREVELHSLDKDHFVFTYADIVSRALVGRGKFPEIWWIESFAGPGRLFVKPLKEYRDGSPVRAMAVKKPFDGYIFNDLSPDCYQSLGERVGEMPGVSIRQEDANADALYQHIVERVAPNALVIYYADPAGLQLEFPTIEKLAKHFPRLDLLLNFPVKSIIRAIRGEQERRRQQGLEGDGEYRAATRVLGNDKPLELITGSSQDWGVSIRQYFQNRLEGIGYRVFDREVIYLHTNRIAVYDLLLASHDPLAKKFFGQAHLRRWDGQSAMDLG